MGIIWWHQTKTGLNVYIRHVNMSASYRGHISSCILIRSFHMHPPTSHQPKMATWPVLVPQKHHQKLVLEQAFYSSLMGTTPLVDPFWSPFWSYGLQVSLPLAFLNTRELWQLWIFIPVSTIQRPNSWGETPRRLGLQWVNSQLNAAENRQCWSLVNVLQRGNWVKKMLKNEHNINLPPPGPTVWTKTEANTKHLFQRVHVLGWYWIMSKTFPRWQPPSHPVSEYCWCKCYIHDLPQAYYRWL